MQKQSKRQNAGISRRDALKLSGLALGGLAATGAAGKHGGGKPDQSVGNCYPTHFKTQQYTYFNQLKQITPWGKDMNGNLTGTKLEANEMRITFMGSVVPMARRAQGEMSIFVEVGWDDEKQQPLDQFILDFGCGVSANYQACGVGYGRMDKIFINHLHADHTTDLIQVHGFGDGGDRKSPLYIWSHGPSGVPNPGSGPAVPDSNNPQPNSYAASPDYYDDGVAAFCTYLREVMRWHTESQAFQSTAYASYPTLEKIASDWGLPYVPAPAGIYPDPPNDANALIPIQLDWWKTGLDSEGKPTGDNIAYNNTTTGAKVLHYPVIHCRKGSMGYKIEWTPPGARKPLTMVYSSDTKPEWNSIHHAINKDANGRPQGVDVFIHEMAVAPEIWAMKMQGLTQPGSGDDWDKTVQATQTVQNSSHTPQGAFGYMLSQINQVKPPRLAVATHFPTADDTVACALKSVQAHCPEIKRIGDQLVWSFDLMVLRVFPDRIEQRRANVNDFSFNPPVPSSSLPQDMYAPKYHTNTGASDPYVQIDMDGETAVAIPPGDNTYREDGY